MQESEKKVIAPTSKVVQAVEEDFVELEETYNDPDDICSMSVIEYEI